MYSSFFMPQLSRLLHWKQHSQLIGISFKLSDNELQMKGCLCFLYDTSSKLWKLKSLIMVDVAVSHGKTYRFSRMINEQFQVRLVFYRLPTMSWVCQNETGSTDDDLRNRPLLSWNSALYPFNWILQKRCTERQLSCFTWPQTLGKTNRKS